MKILVTGCAGFIGFQTCKFLSLKKNIEVIGIDNINNYYDVELKKDRLKILKKNFKNFKFYKLDISNFKSLKKNFLKENYKYVINLAAQAGVRHSINNPQDYLNSNIVGFFNILECSKIFKIKHLIFASTSSVYGNNNKFPTLENFDTSKPLSFYAATKKSNEVMAYSYSNIHRLPCTGLRFFTVYGPFGRPDMSLYKFTKSILNSKPLYLYNNGNHTRDFTYVDDVVRCIFKLINKPSSKKIPFSIINIANSDPKKLKFFLSLIEKSTKKKAIIKYKKLQKGDVVKTHASVKQLKYKIGNSFKTNLSVGIENFVKWYKEYYSIKSKP